MAITGEWWLVSLPGRDKNEYNQFYGKFLILSTFVSRFLQPSINNVFKMHDKIYFRLMFFSLNGHGCLFFQRIFIIHMDKSDTVTVHW